MAESPVQKALLILKELAGHGEPVGVNRLAEVLNLNVSTVHRLLQVLVAENMAAYDPETRHYGVGAECIRLATSVLGRDSPLARMRPALAKLAERLHETCAYFSYEPQSFTKALVLVERGPQPLGYEFEVGQRDGLHAGASGKAILAFLPQDEIERMLLGADLVAATENTVTAPDALRREVVAIRGRGYSTSQGERVPGAGFGIGAPVFGADGRVAGSVVLTVPMFRWCDATLDEKAAEVTACARELSALLGCPSDGAAS